MNLEGGGISLPTQAVSSPAPFPFLLPGRMAPSSYIQYCSSNLGAWRFKAPSKEVWTLLGKFSVSLPWMPGLSSAPQKADWALDVPGWWPQGCMCHDHASLPESVWESGHEETRLAVGPAGTVTSVWGGWSVTWQGWELWEPCGECLIAPVPSECKSVVWETNLNLFTSSWIRKKSASILRTWTAVRVKGLQPQCLDSNLQGAFSQYTCPFTVTHGVTISRKTHRSFFKATIVVWAWC